MLASICPSEEEVSTEELFLLGSVGHDVHIYQPAVILKPEQVHLSDGVRIDSFVKIEGGEGVTLGRWAHISSFAHVGIGGGRVDIGAGVGIAPGARILSGTNVEDGFYMSSVAPESMQKIERSHTVIREGAQIGTNAVVLPGITIGAFARVGAGSVVTKNVPEREVWVGNPARYLRRRHG